MKMNKITLTIAALVIMCHFMGSTNALEECPTDITEGCPYPQGDFPVYYSHPNDCSKFCECGTEGIAWEVHCSPGLYWNDKINACDWPAMVDCGDRPLP